MVLWEKKWFSTWERLKESIAVSACFSWLWSLLSTWLLTHFAASQGGSLLPHTKFHHLSFRVLSQLRKEGDNQVFYHYSCVVSRKTLRFLPRMDHKLLRPQQPNQHKRTSVDESRLCHLILYASRPESWIWSQEKNYGHTKLTHTCSTCVKNTPYQQVAEVCINYSER